MTPAHDNTYCDVCKNGFSWVGWHEDWEIVDENDPEDPLDDDYDWVWHF